MKKSDFGKAFYDIGGSLDDKCLRVRNLWTQDDQSEFNRLSDADSEYGESIVMMLYDLWLESGFSHAEFYSLFEKTIIHRHMQARRELRRYMNEN